MRRAAAARTEWARTGGWAAVVFKRGYGRGVFDAAAAAAH